MTQTEITIGPIKPTSGPLARLGGAAISQNSGAGDLTNQVRQAQQDVRALQDQILAIRQWLDQLIPVPMVTPSGDNHQPGVVPDPGATAGTAKFLREDATWTAVSATALTGVVPLVNGGTASTTGSITGSTALTFTAGGSAQDVTLISSTTGKVILKPGTNSTTAVQFQNAAGTAVVDVDTTNSRVGIGTVAPVDAVHVYGAGAALRIEDSGTNNAALRLKTSTNHYEWINEGGSFNLFDITNSVYLLKMGANGSYAQVGVQLPVYANNAAAVTGGLGAGMLYRLNTDPDQVCIVH